MRNVPLSINKLSNCKKLPIWFLLGNFLGIFSSAQIVTLLIALPLEHVVPSSGFIPFFRTRKSPKPMVPLRFEIHTSESSGYLLMPLVIRRMLQPSQLKRRKSLLSFREDRISMMSSPGVSVLQFMATTILKRQLHVFYSV